VFRLGNYLRGEIFMKKSILMAIVALALLAAPVFAGDYSITANIDWGFGFALGGADDASGSDIVTNDYTQMGFFGAIDDNNSLSITMEYGASGGAADLGTGNGITTTTTSSVTEASLGVDINGDGDLDDAFDVNSVSSSDFSGGNPGGGLIVRVTDFNLTTNILGSFGLTDLPVTLSISAGYGRLNLHNRFQQWTGWEIKRWKNFGAAHFNGSYGFNDPGSWSRPSYLKLNVGILNMVNVTVGMVPYFNQKAIANPDKADIPFMVDIWTSGLAFGPVALDVCANLRADSLRIATGLQVTANMNFGAFGLMAYLGEDVWLWTDSDAGEGIDNVIAIAVKPSYNFGIGSVALGAWMTMNTRTDATNDFNAEDSATQMDMAFDLSATFSKTTIYGGLLIQDLSDVNEDDDSPMKLDIGIKQGFGSASISLGMTAVVSDFGNGASTNSIAGMNDYDIGAADGTGQTWVKATDTSKAMPTLYFRVNAWY
jgi:hypothetical protein